MDLLYKKTLDQYTRAVEKIRMDNTALVDSLGGRGKRRAGLEGCRAGQSLIPYIRADPKTNKDRLSEEHRPQDPVPRAGTADGGPVLCSMLHVRLWNT